jgi:hypothetical protein
VTSRPDAGRSGGDAIAAAAMVIVHELPDGATIEELLPASGTAAAVGAATLGADRRARGWLRAATAWTLRRPDAWAPALVAFLVRGGVVALALPILVLPSPIGIASWVGGDAVTAAGPTDRLIAIIAGAVVAAVATLAIASTVGAAADRIVLRWWSADSLRAGPPAAVGGIRTVVRLIGTRIVALLPVAVAAAWAAPRVADAVYRELILPTDLATPLVVRVLVDSPEAIAALVAALLVGELLGGLAAVHVVADGASGPRALGRSILDIVRRPAAVLGAFALGVGLLVVVVVPPLAIAVVAWERTRDALLDDAGAIAVALPVLALVAGWLATLVCAGGVGAWRRASMATIVAAGEPR